ncbi:hypothetical protein FHR83_004111 [Actinoplanes campanulatus]|uniref:Double-GTPase 2 domain-containing protein n=1 Tax=Actinoplanes campanulatus TaxID=113559 RepID=A0A7W5AI12_9ACTN|nr:hypothetical protein [Actinoplanes campanulatus]MBB3096441.1 hypothetical protein [Actinoplanes campanulatus]GGN18248.1 hypothetical protein GCM10010109_31290 [Actinoplanes campanulatus]GID38507.1 hypothetical protein Aca09nite_50130 [Actinoplanes campanulatus]
MRVIGFAVYYAGALACLLFVTVPVSLVLAGVSLVTGAVAVIVAAGLVLAGPGAGLLTPDGARTGLPGRVAREFVRRDPAWPQYFAAQAILDAGATTGRAWAWTAGAWRAGIAWLADTNCGGFWWPIVVLPVLTVLAAGSLGVAVVLPACLLVIAALTLAAWITGPPLVYLLRGVDAGWRRMLRSRASCTACFATAAVPAYRCRGAHGPAQRSSGDDLHRDLRPGRLGVLWRRCSCGLRLPTMVLRAAHSRHLEACCPSCGEALFAGAGRVRDVRAPVFGAASAGKTQFIMAALVGLHRAADKAGVAVTMPDNRGRIAYEVYADLISRAAPAPKTDTTAPVAVTVRLEQGLNTTLLHLFDAAGETLTDREQNAGLSYLDTAETLTFVLDPFSIRRIRDEHGAASATVFTDANAALHDPEDAYNATAQRLQEYGVRTDRNRLAFVVTKADLLRRLPLTMPGDDSAAVRDWLRSYGLENLVVTAERDFRQVRFFLVSGRDTDPDGPVSVLRWVLMKGWGGIG